MERDQSQALRANEFKAKIDSIQENSFYCLCNQQDKTVRQKLSKCSQKAQTELSGDMMGSQKLFTESFASNMVFDGMSLP